MSENILDFYGPLLNSLKDLISRIHKKLSRGIQNKKLSNYLEFDLDKVKLSYEEN
jgi:hypothetical protein